MSPRFVPVLNLHSIRTLADLTGRIPRRQRWWLAIPGLGERSAHLIEGFFAAHPAFTERARALIAAATPEPVAPWENIYMLHGVDGSHGTFRAPKAMCALGADDDYQAISAWLERHEATETQRDYRAEAEQPAALGDHRAR
nr:phage integrase family protein [Candidatus Burkholderia verschuerenii]